MRLISEEALQQDYQKAGVQGLYVLYSSETYLMEAWRARLLKPFGGDEGFNFQKLDGRKPDWDELFDATQMLPVFADQKCVLLDDLESKLPAEELKKIEQIFVELPPETVLIITVRPPHFDPKSAAGKKLLALADRYGRAIDLSARDTAGMVRFLQSAAKKQGCSLTPALCREILRLCGNDMHVLAGEVAKLCAYAGSGEITREQMDAVLIPKTEARVFDLGKMILAGNAQRSMEILQDLFYLREAPIAILSTLILSYVDLYRARSARDSGIPAPEIITRFGYKGREFRVNNAFSAKISVQALRESLALLAACDRALKSTGADDQILLQRLIIELIAVRGL